MNYVKSIIFYFFFCLSFESFAQILDDSTKQVYDYKTTKYFLEDDLLNNHKTLYTPDTSIGTFHLSNFILRNYWQYQDLGGLGTANQYLYYNPTPAIGISLGLQAYKIYAFDALQTKYYNTKSPFTNMYYVQGANGQTNIRFTHSQNINNRWNVGFDVNRLNAFKQLNTNTETNLVDSWSFMIFSSYESKNKKYQLLANYNHFNHHLIDQGGIAPQSITANQPDSLLHFNSEIVKLQGADSREKWNNFHIYQQFIAFKGLQFFSSIAYKKIDYFYDDTKYATTSAKEFYKLNSNKLLNDTASYMYQTTKYSLLDAKIGVKGYYKGFNYRTHLRYRDYVYKNFWKPLSNTAVGDTTYNGSEVLVGAWASYYFSDSTRKVFAEFEWNTLNPSIINFRGEYFSKFLKLGYYHITSPPTLLQNNFRGMIYDWNNKFHNVSSNNLYAAIDYQIGRISLQPTLNYSIINNYIYFDFNAQPQQATNDINILNIGSGIGYRSPKFLFYTLINYTPALNKQDLIRMPNFAINTRISYEFTYSKVLHINTGFEIYYKSAYKADNYMPLTQQFFLNDKKTVDGSVFTVWGKPVVDLFADFRIRKVRIFLKYAYINSFLNGGYFVTPYYPGLRSGLSLGINWPLFD